MTRTKTTVVLGSGSHAHLRTATKERSLEGRLALVVNTAHITSIDDLTLCNWPANYDDKPSPIPWLAVVQMPCGYLIMPADTEGITENEKGKLSSSFWKLLSFAEDNGFDWVRLDRDGPVIEELENHDW